MLSVPFPSFIVKELIDPEPVPAPINDLTSEAEIPEFNEGVDPLDVIAGVPVSETLSLFAAIAFA